jgi:acylphosphatase
MSDKASLQAVVSGRVQGVYFRAFVAEKAGELGLTGYILNLPNGFEVEVKAEGDEAQLEKLLDYLRVGSPGSIVKKVVFYWGDYQGKYSAFKVEY